MTSKAVSVSNFCSAVSWLAVVVAVFTGCARERGEIDATSVANLSFSNSDSRYRYVCTESR